jgi:glycosyltransferase involved in cell wall biosynthesis
MDKKLLFSIIITAFDRREYLMNAIQSVINQTFDMRLFEIILIKNFEDRPVDSFCQQNGIYNILTLKEPLKEKIMQALELCSGEFISFLEDDDIFAKNKLEHISRLYQKHPKLVYYHNDFIPINKKGEETAFVNVANWFNLSCTTVKREVLNLEKFSQIQAIELFMYSSAIFSSGTIVSDNFKGTFYRFHSSASNSPKESFKREIDESIRKKNNYFLELKMFQKLFRKGRNLRLYNSIQTNTQIELYLLGESVLAKNILNYAISRESNKDLRTRVKRISLYFAARILPKLIRKYYMRKKMEDYYRSIKTLKEPDSNS